MRWLLALWLAAGPSVASAAVWVVNRATEEVVDYSEDETLRYDDRFMDHVLVPAGAKPPGDAPTRYMRSGGVIVKKPPTQAALDLTALKAILDQMAVDSTLPQRIRDFAAALRKTLP